MEKIERVFEIRVVEERIKELFDAGVIGGTVHLSMGQEVADVQIMGSYEDPFVFGNHRSHGQYLALTGDVEGLIYQVIGNMTQHLSFPGRFQGGGIQGGLAPVAAGMAYAFKKKGINRRVLCFIGDGTTGEGVLYEAFNIASIYDCPVTYVLYNNGYSMGKTLLKNDVHVWAEGIGRTFGIAVSHARLKGAEGPELHVRKVRRLCGHSCNDTQMYRPKEERTQEWRDAYDPLVSLRAQFPDSWERVRGETLKRIDKITSPEG